MSATVTVIAVTYSPGEHLANFLRSLEDATTEELEVILVDNGSTDGAPEEAVRQAKEYGTPIRMIRTPKNIGFGAAANYGIRAAEAEWVVVANPDVIWRQGALDQLLAALSRWPRAGAVGPAIVTPEGDLYPSARAIPTLKNGVGHAIFGWIWPTNPWTRAYRHDAHGPEERETGWLSGACMLLRRDVVLALGGFDPAYFMYFEDVDMCDRLGKAGWQVVYVPTAVATHVGGHAAERAPLAMMREHHKSAYRFLAHRYAGLRWLPVRVVLRIGLAARLQLSRLFGRVSEGAAIRQRASDLPDPRES